MSRKRWIWILVGASLLPATSVSAQTVVEPLDRQQSWSGQRFDTGGSFRDFDFRSDSSPGYDGSQGRQPQSLDRQYPQGYEGQSFDDRTFDQRFESPSGQWRDGRGQFDQFGRQLQQRRSPGTGMQQGRMGGGGMGGSQGSSGRTGGGRTGGGQTGGGRAGGGASPR